MNCRELERWLDDGGAPERYLEAIAHARICAGCSTALGALDEIETLLASPAVPAPAGFSARVMARVAVAPQMPASIPVLELLPLFQTVPWWVRATLDPASLLALLLASTLIWRGDTLYALASGAALQLAAWLARSLPSGPPIPAPVADPGSMVALWLQPTVLASITLAATPLAFMGSRVLYRWTATLAGPRQARPAVR